MNRCHLLVLALMVFVSCQEVSTQDEEENFTSPNILLIVADDMGLDAAPGYDVGTVKPNMPTLDSLMSNGVKFNNVWSNPTCTPTRGTMLTGKYGFRTDVTKVDDAMSTSETSVQSYIDQNGNSIYTNAVIGKWHLSKDATHPLEMGVDYFAGFTGGAIQSYTDWDFNDNGTITNTIEYSTTKFTDLAIDWVGDQEQPWFLWLAYNAPHTPFHLPPIDLHSQGDLPSDESSIAANPLPYYMAMLEAMDSEMGRLIGSLSDEERNNTVIIFIGDNGTPTEVVQEYATRRAKGSLYQGGVNVPMVVSGVNIDRVNESEDALISTVDIFATIANLVGVETDAYHDSQSFAALLSNEDAPTRSFVYSEVGNDDGTLDYTVRDLTHKYISFSDGTEGFYDLSISNEEKPNLLNENRLPLSDEDQLILDALKVEVLQIKGE